MDSTTLISQITTLLTNGVKFGGGFLIVWGAVQIGSNLKDHNGPAISNGIWTIVGGAIVVAAGIMFGSLTWAG